MELFQQQYFKHVNDLVVPYGFMRCKNAFVRVTNDVLHSFHLDIFSRTQKFGFFRIYFGIIPLNLTKYDRAGMPYYGHYELTPGFPLGAPKYLDNDGYSSLMFDGTSEGDVNTLVDILLEDIRMRLIPHFERATDSKAALDENWEMDKAISVSFPKTFKGLDLTLWGHEGMYSMALKHRRYDYILHAYEVMIGYVKARAAERNWTLENRLDYMKDDVRAELERNEAEEMARIQKLIDGIPNIDEEKIQRELEENEAYSRKHLKRYIV